MPDVTISAKDLQEILRQQAEQNAQMLRDVIREVKAPNVIEQKKLDEEARLSQIAQENRKKTAGQVLEEIENKKAMQRICSHIHADAARGTHCVYIVEKGGAGYILCQKCIAKVRPGPAPKGYKGNDIYDTVLFNQLFQTLPSNEMMG